MQTTGDAPRGPRASLAALAGVAALAVSGCSEGAPPAAGAAAGIDLATVRACELLTTVEIEAETGVAVDAGVDVSQAGGRLPICNWRRAGSETEVALTLLVTNGRYRTYEEFLQSARESAFGDFTSGADLEEVAGVGDFGVWMRDALMLQVYDGDVMVQVDATVAMGRDEIEASRALAGAVLAKLR